MYCLITEHSDQLKSWQASTADFSLKLQIGLVMLSTANRHGEQYDRLSQQQAVLEMLKNNWGEGGGWPYAAKVMWVDNMLWSTSVN